jgi:DNA-binding response OmpR family regulator
MTRALSHNLTREGYDVVVAHDGQEGVRKAIKLVPDLVILEVVIAELDGLEVCRELRAEPKTRFLPILMLTIKAEEADQIAGFSVGADDYVTKPFSMKVLLQRVRALIWRANAGAEIAPDVIEHLRLRIDLGRHRATYRDQELTLTLTEFRLLESLLRQPGRVLTRQQLIDAAMKEGANVLDRTVDIHIKTIRRKLGRADLIETVRGVGYRLREEAGKRASRTD